MAGHSPLSTRLQTHINSTNFFHQPLANELVNQRLDQTGEAFEAYEAVFDQRIDVLARSLVFLLIPLFALMSGLVLFWKKEYAIKHLVFSCHMISFILAYVFVLAIVFDWTGFQLQLRVSEWAFSLFIMGVICLYLVWGIRRVYALKWVLSVFLSVVMTLGFFVILMIYRAVLFFAAYYSLA